MFGTRTLIDLARMIDRQAYMLEREGDTEQARQLSERAEEIARSVTPRTQTGLHLNTD